MVIVDADWQEKFVVEWVMTLFLFFPCLVFKYVYPNPNYHFDRPIENGNMAKSLRKQVDPIKLDNYMYITRTTKIRKDVTT